MREDIENTKPEAGKNDEQIWLTYGIRKLSEIAHGCIEWQYGYKQHISEWRPYLGTFPEASGRRKERIKVKIQRIEVKIGKSK